MALITSCFPFHTLRDGTGAGVGVALLVTFSSSLVAVLEVGRVLMDVLESVDGPNIFSLRPFQTDGPLMVYFVLTGGAGSWHSDIFWIRRTFVYKMCPICFYSQIFFCFRAICNEILCK